MKTVAAGHTFASAALRWLPLALVLAFAGPTASRAETTPWASNEGGRMRLIALPPARDGTVRGALQIEPNPGWITYWREPGDAGIPPQLMLPAEAGVSLKRLAYPVPKRITSGDLQDIGYDHPVTLPFELRVEDATKALDVGVSAFVGLCRNICIPFQASFSLDLGDAQHSMEEAMLLASAETQLPEAPSEEFAVTGHALTDDNMLQLELRLPSETVGVPQVIVTGPEGHAFLDSKDAKKNGRNYSLHIPIEKLPADYDVSGKSWGVLVIAGSRAMETSLAFE